MPEPRWSQPERPRLIEVPASGGVPPLVAPMRPRLVADAFNSPEWLFELKWDGIRAVAYSGDDGFRLLDRHGGDLLPLVPELRDARLPAGTVIDAEIVVCDTRGRPSYELLAARAGPKALRRGRGPYLVAFDLLYAEGRSLLGTPLVERRELLRDGPYAGRHVLVPEHLDADGEPFLDVVSEYGLEGIVAKRRDSRYVPGVRTGDWLKCHVTPRADVVVGGLIVDERRGAVSLLCGLVNEAGALAYAGDAYVPPYLASWLEQATRDLAAEASPFATPLSLRTGLRWLRPRLVAMVEHDGEEPPALVDARFRALRFDARPDECRPEVPVEVPSSGPPSNNERPRLVLLQSLPFN